MARQSDPTGRIEFRHKAELDWKAAFAGNTRKKPSFKKKRAGIDLCQAEIIDFLATDNSVTGTTSSRKRAASNMDDGLPTGSVGDVFWAPDPESIGHATPTEVAQSIAEVAQSVNGDTQRADTLASRVDVVANYVIHGALDDIAQELDGTMSENVKIALADHFWCDLLAQLAHAIDEGLKHLDSVPDRVADWVMKSRERSRWRYLEDRVVRTAARSVWRKVRLVTFSGLLNRTVILPVIRLLAILSCKAPERHQAVVEYCVDPLGKRLFAVLKERLVDVLSEWLPRMRGRRPEAGT